MSDKLIAYVNQKLVTHMYIILDLRKPWIVLTIKFCFQRHFTIEHKGSLSNYSHTNNKKNNQCERRDVMQACFCRLLLKRCCSFEDGHLKCVICCLLAAQTWLYSVAHFDPFHRHPLCIPFFTQSFEISTFAILDFLLVLAVFRANKRTHCCVTQHVFFQTTFGFVALPDVLYSCAASVFQTLREDTDSKFGGVLANIWRCYRLYDPVLRMVWTSHILPFPSDSEVLKT